MSKYYWAKPLGRFWEVEAWRRPHRWGAGLAINVLSDAVELEVELGPFGLSLSRYAGSQDV